MTARQWVDAYGMDPTSRIARRLGGRLLYMSRTPGQAQKVLREELGEAAAETLREKHAGGQVEVPQLVVVNALIERDIVRRLAEQLIHERHSDHTIARVLKISPNTVRKLRARMPEGVAA